MKHAITRVAGLPFYCKAGLPQDALAALEDLGVALSTEDLQHMNYLHSVEKMDAEQVATDWLTENGLV